MRSATVISDRELDQTRRRRRDQDADDDTYAQLRGFLPTPARPSGTQPLADAAVIVPTRTLVATAPELTAGGRRAAQRRPSVSRSGAPWFDRRATGGCLDRAAATPPGRGFCPVLFGVLLLALAATEPARSRLARR